MLIAISVVITPSMVAMLGCIIPEPLAIPPIITSTPSRSKLTAHSLEYVSVVIMASAAKVPVSLEESSWPTKVGIPLRMVSIGRCLPITPVEAV